MEKIKKEQVQFNYPSAILVTDMTSPETFPAHWHDAAEFIVALTENCSYRVNDILYDLEKGDVLLVWPQQIHEIIRAPYGGVIFVQFSSIILENNLDLVSISRFLYECHHISARTCPGLAEAVSKSIFDIQKIHSSSNPLSETRCKLCIYETLLKIGEYVMAENQKEYVFEKNSGSVWTYIHAACNYIAEKSTENITQSEVASHVGLSTFYFSKLFKQHMHISFPAYLSNIRVKNAASLLLNNNLSITECAFLAGFQSTTAFNKAFHDITGYSPRDFRKLYK